MEYRSLPDLKGLATLRAVVEMGGVNEAARAMNVGQPAITKRLRTLDQCYGIALMHREGRKLELTVAGEKVYSYSRLVLDRQASLQDDLEFMHLGQNRLRLEVTFAIGEHILPDLLFSFADAYPEYRIESRMGYTRRIQTRLATGFADVALLEQAPNHPNIKVQKWLDDELVLVCGAKHAFNGCAQINLNQLTQLKYVLRESKSSMRLILDKALRQVGIDKIPITMEVGSTDTIMEMLARGKHVSFLPRFAVNEALREGDLFHIPIDGLSIKQTLWIAFAQSSMDNVVARAFIQQLSEQG